MNYAMIAIGGALGAVARYACQGLVYRWVDPPFPYGTLAVNVVGCFLIGLVMSSLEGRFSVDPLWRLFVTVGILGGFTTFSSFGFETLALMRDGEMLLAGSNIVANVFFGIGAVWLGHVVARLF